MGHVCLGVNGTITLFITEMLGVVMTQNSEMGEQWQSEAHPPTKKKRLIWVVSLVLILLLAGGGVGTFFLIRSLNSGGDATTSTQTTQNDKTTENTQTDKPAKTEEPKTIAVEDIVMPSCESISPEGHKVMTELAASGFDISVPHGEVGADVFAQHFGPVAQKTLAKAVNSQGCFYVIHTEGGYAVFVAAITPSDQQGLITALKADDRFLAGTIGKATSYISSASEETSIGTITTAVGHAFEGNVWVSMSGSGNSAGAEKNLTDALDAVYQVNPGLGG